MVAVDIHHRSCRWTTLKIGGCRNEDEGFRAVATFLLLCSLGSVHFAKAQRSGSARQAWVYHVDEVPERTVTFPHDPAQQAAIQNLLAQRGAEGWELVTEITFTLRDQSSLRYATRDRRVG